jgi:hypothetical protein
MKSFLPIFLVITGLIFLKPDDPKAPRTSSQDPAAAPTRTVQASKDQSKQPLREPAPTAQVTTKEIPSLAERTAQRNAHLGERLAAAQAHGPNCACGAHRKR